MADFPTTFSAESVPITAAAVVDLDEAAAQAIEELAGRGFSVTAGLRHEDLPEITAIAGQPGVREFCPRDLTERWGDEAMAQAELAKDDGHAVFRLIHDDTSVTAGFGWVRPLTGHDEQSRLLPDCWNTFALRISQDFRGQHLATPFTRAVIAGARLLYDATDIGLETWASNIAAVKADERAGAVQIASKDDTRSTLVPEDQDAHGKRPDTRLYMQFMQSMTDKAA